MIIRRTIPDDALEISKLEERVFSDPWSEKDISARIVAQDGMCYSALSDTGELWAYLIGSVIAPEGEIYRIATVPEQRNRGIAHKLLSYALKTEMGRGLETVFLEVRSQNLSAIKLYRSFSFQEINRRKNYYRNPTDDAIIMMRSPSSEI